MVEPKMKSDDSSDAKENLYDHISRTEEPKHYANMVEYARDLQPWLYQYRFWSAMSHISSLMPYYMLQNCSSANQVPAATSQRVSNLTNGAIPNQQNQGSHQQQNQNNQQQQQHHHNLAQNGVEYIIPSLWRRVAAETIDFIVLFYIKVMLTVMVLRHLGYLRDDNLLEVRLDIVPILEFAEMDLEKAFNITSEIIALEIINRIMITLFETLCLRKGFGGIVGGATPGKKVLGMKVISCTQIIDLHNGKVMVIPAKDPGFISALVRSVIKNFTMAFFFPACLTVFFFEHKRAAYDILSKTLVVQTDEPRWR